MFIDFTWNIAQLERNLQDGYVFTVHYVVNAQNKTHKVNTYGSIDLKRPDTLIPFADLTKDLVVSWVKDYFGEEKVTEIEATLQAQLDEQAAPTKAVGFPW
jgi:hypothetical protein